MNKTINYTQVRKALLLALEEFDVMTIFELSYDDVEKHCWKNGCKALNGLDHKTLEFVYSQLQGGKTND